MRFFTRELYDRCSQAALGPIDDGFEARVEKERRLWADANQRYLNYLRLHDAQLSQAARKMNTYTLHDAVIERI